MDANRAVFLKHLGFVEDLFPAAGADLDLVSILGYLEHFAVHRFGDFPFVDHPQTRNADNGELLPLDLVFQDVGDDISAVASLGHHRDLFLAVGQVNHAGNAFHAVFFDQRLQFFADSVAGCC